MFGMFWLFFRFFDLGVWVVLFENLDDLRFDDVLLLLIWLVWLFGVGLFEIGLGIFIVFGDWCGLSKWEVLCDELCVVLVLDLLDLFFFLDVDLWSFFGIRKGVNCVMEGFSCIGLVLMMN